MNRIGEAVRVAQGLIVVRAPDDGVPDVGSAVVNEDLEDVGEIVEVFGPVDRPYCSVAPASELRPAAVLGEPLYAR